MVESREDSMNKNKKRKREDAGSEACRGVKTSKAIVAGIRKNPGRAVKGLKSMKDRRRRLIIIIIGKSMMMKIIII